MGKKRVEIILNTRQRFADGTVQKQTQTYQGIWYVKGDVHYFHYQEDHKTGLGNTKTTLKVAKDAISLIRQGEVTMRHVYQEQVRFPGTYQTPFGHFSFVITTDRMEKHLHDGFGRFRLSYHMDMEGESSYMDVVIKVKAIDNDTSEKGFR